MVDLHLHSTASDGTHSPTQVVELARSRGLRAIALSDHDSVEGVEEALAAGERLGVEVIPAVELGSETSGEEDVHLIGYWVDYRNPELAGYLEGLRRSRVVRAQHMVDCLQRLGCRIDLDRVMALAGEGAVGRSHVARALVEAGAAGDIAEAFDRYIGRGRPCYLKKGVTRPVEAVGLLKRFGAVVVLAHPGLGEAERRIGELVEAGLDGLEVYHSEHTPEQVEHFKQIAVRHGIIWTGGSDCHGGGSHRGLVIGTVPVPDEALDQLRVERQHTGILRP